MKYHILLILMIILPLQAFAQKDARARQVLDGMSAEYSKSAGTTIVFDGTLKGTIALKGDKFVLDCGGIKSWFDGETLWSYVEDNEEVNVSSPTAEEIQAINPYAMIGMYKNGFNYTYAGTKNINGMRCEDVILTPEKKQDIKKISIAVDSKKHPVYVRLENSQGDTQEFKVKEYKTQNLTDTFFRFNPKDYPNAEIIDLR